MSGKIKLGKQIHERSVENPPISLLKIDISIQGVFNNLNQSNMYINSIRFFFFPKDTETWFRRTLLSKGKYNYFVVIITKLSLNYFLFKLLKLKRKANLGRFNRCMVDLKFTTLKYSTWNVQFEQIFDWYIWMKIRQIIFAFAMDNMMSLICIYINFNFSHFFNYSKITICVLNFNTSIDTF